MQIIATPLTPLEQAELDHHLTQFRSSFMHMIKSLAVIHGKRLYRGDGHRTWGEFCVTELGFSRRAGNYWIQAISVLDKIERHNELADEPLPLPTKQAQTRVLATLADEDIITVWRATIAKHGASAQAKDVKSIADSIASALLEVGASYEVSALCGEIATKHQTGADVVSEMVNTGYLQFADEDEIIPIADVTIRDVKRMLEELRREAIMQRVANEGGVTITIYPNDAVRTAKIILDAMPTNESASTLCAELDWLFSVRAPRFWAK